MIDSADLNRIEIVKRELFTLLSHPGSQERFPLVFCRLHEPSGHVQTCAIDTFPSCFSPTKKTCPQPLTLLICPRFSFFSVFLFFCFSSHLVVSCSTCRVSRHTPLRLWAPMHCAATASKRAYGAENLIVFCLGGTFY